MRKLNPKEEQIMQILWRLEKAFVKEIMAELPDPKPPVTTVSSLVRKLEKEGLIGFEAFGKTHRYYPRLSKTEYGKNSFRSVFQNYFGGSPERILSFFLEEEELDQEELNRLLEKVRRAE